MNTQVYKKLGRKYVPVGYSDGFTGFPCDGIWLVQTKPGSKSTECMMRIGEVQDMRPTLDMLIGYKDKIVRYIMDNSMDGISPNDYVKEMIKSVTANTEEE